MGSGGLDSDRFEVFAGDVRTFEASGTGDSTKIRYITPAFGGVRLGASYTPDLASINGGGGGGGDLLAGTDVEAGDVAEAGARFEGELGAAGLTAGLTGLYGDIKDEDAAGGDDDWQWQAGASATLGGISPGGSYLQEEVGSLEAGAVTPGLGAALGPLELALAYGRFLATDGLEVNGNELDEPYLIIVSATVGLLPGLTPGGDIGYFDDDADEEAEDFGGGDGWQGVGQLGLAS